MEYQWEPEGMKYSLVSREVIADSIETVVGCEGLDGLIAYRWMR
jgi:dihydroxy-acid dehydratase